LNNNKHHHHYNKNNLQFNLCYSVKTER
jgi:hypothetical protein